MKNGKSKAVAITAMLLLANGCSSFNRQWKETVHQPIPSDLSGPWEGHWISDVNGHNGKLRCLITPGVTNDFDANFHATYMKVMTFGYSVPLQARNLGDHFEF